MGFDWHNHQQVLRKVHEELGELLEAVDAGDDDATEDELGDLLFAVSQLGRKLGVDPDRALRRTNRKFTRRFERVEARYEHDRERLRSAGLEELMRAWAAAKREEADGRD